VTGPPSDADRDLAGKLDVTPRQVKRWREAGYIPGPNRRGLGRGLGTVALYSPQAAEQTADFALALKSLKRLDDAALVTFFHGYSLRDETLRRVYSSAFAQVRKFLGAAPNADPWELADRWSRTLSRRASEGPTGRWWRANLNDKGKGGQLQPALADLIRFFLGGAAADERISHEVFEATGTDGLVALLPEEDQERLHGLLGALNLPGLEEAVGGASLNQLERARDQLRETVGFFGTFDLATEYTLALVGVPAVLVAGSFLGTTLALGLSQLREEGAKSSR
jgi:hypothetical protein